MKTDKRASLYWLFEKVKKRIVRAYLKDISVPNNIRVCLGWNEEGFAREEKNPPVADIETSARAHIPPGWKQRDLRANSTLRQGKDIWYMEKTILFLSAELQVDRGSSIRSCFAFLIVCKAFLRYLERDICYFRALVGIVNGAKLLNG